MQTLEQLRHGALAGAVRLQLSCGLTTFPREIFSLADTLEILDLSGNALSALPDDLPRLHRLRVLFCSFNDFTALPAVLGRCPALRMIGFRSNRITTVADAALPPTLRWLVLTDNRIASLPASIGRCSKLQKLMLAGNRLQALPAELAACRALELVRISANQLTALPGWLPALPRLAWLAFAGNPFCAGEDGGSGDAAGSAAPIPWQQLDLAHQLGEGASGIIYQATLASAGTAPLPVAVKVFKGEVTSDGLPACEMAACMAAGNHPHLIPVLGAVTGHPDGRHGCVMALIDPRYRRLADPPSLDSCTRDVYPSPARLRLPLPALLRLALGIASATAHLHQRGIMHGDLYGHNILCTDGGDALLGDFGAASRFDRHGALGPRLQQLEALAFGILLGELIMQCDTALPPGLAQLQQRCSDPDPARRPLFGAIVAALAAAQA